MTTRLTKAARKDIATELLARTDFAERRKRIEEKRLALGNQLAELVYTPSETKLMGKLPLAFFHRQRRIQVRLGGAVRLYPTYERPVSYAHATNYSACTVLDLNARHPLAEQAELLHSEAEALSKEEDALSSKIHAIVSTATTVEALQKLWPDAATLLEKYKTVSERGVLCIPSELNKQLNLPAKEKTVDA